MQVHYINLDSRADRNQSFLDMNSTIVDCRRVAAVDGRRLNLTELVKAGVVHEPTPAYSAGSLGCALSHKGLWEQCVTQDMVLTVAEDDAIFNRGYSDKATGILAKLPSDWDIMLWGWNFDSILHVAVIDGVKQSIMRFESSPLGAKIPRFQDGDYDALPLRFLGGFGLVCYSISPKGARRMLDSCFPLKVETIGIPGLGRTLPNVHIDFLLNKYYHTMKAYVSFPPLVWTENDKANSDIASEGHSSQPKRQ